MKIEMSVTLCTKFEVPMLDAALAAILPKTKHDISPTLYLSRYSDQLFESCYKIAEKYNMSFEPRGDNSLLHYTSELSHRAYDVKGADVVLTIQPDCVLLKDDIFDTIVDQAAPYFDSKYMVCVTSHLPNDTSPLGVIFRTKLGWDRLGCEDINFYPQAGVEHDMHRRSYLSWGLDPNDLEQYLAPLDGAIDPPWIHRIRTKEFHHVGKPWHAPPWEPSPPRVINYSQRVFWDCVLRDSFTWYYVQKWGDTQSNETFVRPFNNPNYDQRIAFEVCENPYPETKPITLRGLVI